MTSLDTVRHQAELLLLRWFEEPRVLELRPEVGDYDRVFVEKVAALARNEYASWWADPQVPAIDRDTTLIVNVAESDELGRATERAQKFPAGYAAIAALLAPGNIWVCWKFVAPGQRRGIAFDGLVYLDGRWAWFPKPYKVLASTRDPFAHYAE